MAQKEYLFAVIGRIPGSDDDSILLVEAINTTTAHDKFIEEMEADSGRNDEEVAFCEAKFDASVYVTGTECIGEILPGGLILRSLDNTPAKLKERLAMSELLEALNNFVEDLDGRFGEIPEDCEAYFSAKQLLNKYELK